MESAFAVSAITIVIVILYLSISIKVLAEHERGVIIRLGRLLEQAKGPGIVLVFPPMDRLVRVSLKEEALPVPARSLDASEKSNSPVDCIGITQTTLSPRGKVLVRGQLWDAISPVNVSAGKHIIVRQLDGGVLRVQPVVLTKAMGAGS